MTAPGVPTSGTIEFYLGGVWTDVSAFVALEAGISRRVGRATPFDKVQPGTLSFVLRNDDGRFTPDNPTSPYFPYIVEGVGVRWKVTKGATYSRFVGFVDTWQPDFPGGELLQSTVSVSASDVLATLATRTLHPDWAEQVRAYVGTSTWGDVFTLAETQNATSARNIGFGGLGTLTVVPANDGTGASQFGSALDDMLGEGSWAVTVAGANRKGPALRYDVPAGQGGIYGCDLWFRIDEAIPTTAADLYTVATFYSTRGEFRWRLLAVGNNDGTYTLRVECRDSVTGNIIGGVLEGNPNPAQRHTQGQTVHVHFLTNGASTMYVNGVLYSYSGAFTPPNAFDVGTIVLGGGTSTNLTNGKQSNGWSATYGGLAVWNQGSTSTLYAYGNPAATVAGDVRTQELAKYAGVLSSLHANGTDVRTVKRMPAGMSAFDALAQVALTVGADLYVDGAGLVQTTFADVARSTTPALTVTLESDDDATQAMPWRRAVDVKATRVTGTCPDGSAVAIDTVAEAAGQYREQTVDTCAASVSRALEVASAVLNQSVKLRVAQLSVDVATAATDLYATALAVVPGSRARLANVPSTHFGVTQVDAYVQAITETLTEDSYQFVFDTSPADAPPEARFDDAVYGRFATAGNTTLSGAITNSGTTVVIATPGGYPTFTTSAGDYPLDIDLNGERVTLNSAPGGSTSPQTFTGVTRGVAPSVARAHSSGEPVEVFDAATFAL